MFRLIGSFLKFTLKMGVLACGIGAIIAYANLSDVDGWKQDLQKRVSTISGRKLSVDGAIDFKVSFPPQIIVEGVRIQNAPWGSRPDMLRAKKLIAEVDFLPLLFGDVAVPRLQLVGVDILIESKASGVSNWDVLSSLQASSDSSSSNPSFPAFGPVFGSSGVGISGGTVTVSNLATGAVNVFNLPGTLIDIGG